MADARSLLVPAFCHHQFKSFPASSSFPLYLCLEINFLFLPSLVFFLGAVHPQAPSDPFLLTWSLPLCPALRLLCCLVLGPPVNIPSALFPPPVSAHNCLAPPCTPSALHPSSPIICCRGERERGLWKEHGESPSLERWFQAAASSEHHSTPFSLRHYVDHVRPCGKDGKVRRQEGSVAGKSFPLCHSCIFPLLQAFKCDLKGSLGFFEFDVSQKGPRVCQVWFFAEKHKKKHKALCLLCLSVCGNGVTHSKWVTETCDQERKC